MGSEMCIRDRPKRAYGLEQLVIGEALNEELITQASAVLSADFQPISDARASAGYRLQIAQNLFRRLCLEVTDTSLPSRVGAHV